MLALHQHFRKRRFYGAILRRLLTYLNSHDSHTPKIIGCESLLCIFAPARFDMCVLGRWALLKESKPTRGDGLLWRRTKSGASRFFGEITLTLDFIGKLV